MEFAKPPVPVEIVDLKNFARFVMGLVDEPPLIWHFHYNNHHILGTFSAYMFWSGDIPLFVFIKLEEDPKPFLAYRSTAIKGEEVLFTHNMEDTKYQYSPLIDLADPPSILKMCVSGSIPTPPRPLLTPVSNLQSIVRTLLFLSSRGDVSFPLWHFKRGNKCVMGTCVPFEHYYEADALPVFFYLQQDKPPLGAFLRYRSTKQFGEVLEYTNNTLDTKFFYVKIINVKNLLIFP